VGTSIARVGSELEGAVLTLTLENPSRANALTDGMLEELAAAAAAPPPGTRAILLRGSGPRHFSSGVDLGGDPTPARLRESERRLGSTVEALRDSPVPVIAVLNGSAYGGALEVALACDWRVAATDIELAMPPGRLGVVYSLRGLRLFVATIGPARTAELFLTGAPVDAERALAFGLVNALYAPDELLPRAREAARRVAAAAPIAVQGTVALIRALGEAAVPDGTQESAEQWRARAYASTDLAEGLAAFRERRAPRFTGA
jgi:enoyl-CoA hydratase